MFQNVLVGILPCKEEYWQFIKDKIDQFEDTRIRWRSFAKIEDEGTPTLVVSAVVNTVSELQVDPNIVIQKIQEDLVNEFCSDRIQAEMWATAPCPLDLQPKKGHQLTKSYDEHDWQKWTTDTLREFGIIVQNGILSKDRVQEIRALVDIAIQDVEDLLAFYRPEIEIGQDSFLFQEIASRNLQRFDLRLTDSAAAKFVETEIMQHPAVESILKNCLGSYDEIDFDISCVYSRPGACHQGWHADGDHQKGGKYAGWEDDGWKTSLSDPFAICLFIPLIDLNDDVGFTQFWPKSHWSRDLAGLGKIAELTNTTFDALGKAGDAIFYDYRLMHRGMPNKSDVVRPVLQVVAKKNWYVEKANYGEESIVKK